MKRANILLLSVTLFYLYGSIYGMFFVQEGPDTDHPTTAQPDWAKGIVELPRHPSRILSIGGMGSDEFYFKADASQINELLDLYSKARMRDHEVWLNSGVGLRKTSETESIEYNVGLQIRVGKEPQLTIYTHDSQTLVEQLKLNDNIILHCNIESCSLKSPAVKPQRDMWYGAVQFDDGTWSNYAESGIRSTVTLWQKGIEGGIKVSNVGSKDYGAVSIPFSAAEIEQLKAGDSWLTITMGNWLTDAKPDDPGIAAEMLSRDPAKVKPVTIKRPAFYYGRILFEDGTSPVLEPLPWPGAEIHLDFAYAGTPSIDEQGRFQIFFTNEQFETLKAQKARKNIYIPSYTQKNSSTAKYIFPVNILSQDKDHPGVVKIPRPEVPESLKRESE